MPVGIKVSQEQVTWELETVCPAVPGCFPSMEVNYRNAVPGSGPILVGIS